MLDALRAKVVAADEQVCQLRLRLGVAPRKIADKSTLDVDLSVLSRLPSRLLVSLLSRRVCSSLSPTWTLSLTGGTTPVTL